MADLNADNAIDIHGLVIPVDWDGEGRVTAVGISSFDEVEYLLHQNAKAREMLSLIHRRVRVRGRLLEDFRGRKVLTVLHYTM